MLFLSLVISSVTDVLLSPAPRLMQGPWPSLKAPLGSFVISQVTGPVPGECEVERIQFNAGTFRHYHITLVF